MPDETSYEALIAGYDWDELLELWAAISIGQTPGWDSGKALEYLIVRAFELDQAAVKWPYRIHEGAEEIEQIDGVVYCGAIAALIECKDTADRVNIEPIAKLRNQLLRRPAGTIGAVFSRNGFTDAASILARFLAPQTILLWDGAEIHYALTKRKMCDYLLLKYRRCIEYGLPNYNIRNEELS